VLEAVGEAAQGDGVAGVARDLRRRAPRLVVGRLQGAAEGGVLAIHRAGMVRGDHLPREIEVGEVEAAPVGRRRAEKRQEREGKACSSEAIHRCGPPERRDGPCRGAYSCTKRYSWMPWRRRNERSTLKPRRMSLSSAGA